MQPLGTKKITGPFGKRNNATSWDENLMQPLSTQKIAQTLKTKKQIMQRIGTKKNQGTSREKENPCNLLGQKKITQLLGTKKIMQPLRTKKSHNLLTKIITQSLRTKNHPTSWDKINATSQDEKSCNLSNRLE